MSQIDVEDDMRPHYDFDYTKAKPNRFAEKYNEMVRRVGIAADVAAEFPTEESVNDALRNYMRIRKITNLDVVTR